MRVTGVLGIKEDRLSFGNQGGKGLYSESLSAGPTGDQKSQENNWYHSRKLNGFNGTQALNTQFYKALKRAERENS